MAPVREGDVCRTGVSIGLDSTRSRDRCPVCKSWISSVAEPTCKMCGTELREVTEHTYLVVTRGQV